jgi:hypothetical protein
MAASGSTADDAACVPRRIVARRRLVPNTAGSFYEVIVRVCGAEVWPPTVTVIVAVPG